jgi:hypothetical protein
MSAKMLVAQYRYHIGCLKRITVLVINQRLSDILLLCVCVRVVYACCHAVHIVFPCAVV